MAKRNPLILFFVGALVAVMLFAGIRLARNKRMDLPANGQLMGVAAPDFELQSLDGKNLKFSSLRGKAVLLNFWATYCGPCKVEMPWFVELQNEYGPQGFQIVGVAMDDDASTEDIAKFAKDMGVNYPILLGKEAVGLSYGGVNVLPTTFFVDRNGKIIAREFGLQSRSVFVDHIKEALAPNNPVRAQK
ncbi:MAG TPA: TlpA disulfide reductase family protein [Terriglobales bacterium]|nr:TlpA disulfide reductase family protein [Terriglobales bacterium]